MAGYDAAVMRVRRARMLCDSVLRRECDALQCLERWLLNVLAGSLFSSFSLN